MVEIEKIPELATGSSFSLSYLWVPTVEGIYNITAYAPPVPGEELVANNVAKQFVSVFHIPGIPSTHIIVAPNLTLVAPLQTFTVNIIVANVENMAAWQVSLKFDSSILECLSVSIPADNIFAGKTIIAPEPLIDNTAGTIFYGATAFPFEGVSGNGTLCKIEFKSLGLGTSLIEFVLIPPYRTLLLDVEENELPFTPHSGIVQVVEGPPAQPDIAITYVETSHTAVYPGRIVNITVVAENLGETYVTFNVSVYCNTSLIDSRTIFDLSPQENVTLIFSWNTSGLTPCQIFTIRAEATPITRRNQPRQQCLH